MPRFISFFLTSVSSFLIGLSHFCILYFSPPSEEIRDSFIELQKSVLERDLRTSTALVMDSPEGHELEPSP